MYNEERTISVQRLITLPPKQVVLKQHEINMLLFKRITQTLHFELQTSLSGEGT